MVKEIVLENTKEVKSMNKLTKEILDYLVTQYESAAKTKMINDHSLDSEQKDYYFLRLEDNLREPMGDDAQIQYGEGEGNELELKMRSIRSSSALTYNLFGNGPVDIKDNNPHFTPGIYNICYEKQLPAIRRSPRRANLDAFLESEEELIFFEMKMTEWIFNNPGMVSHNYLDKGHYFHEESYEAFLHLIKGITMEKTTDNGAYYSKLKQYDGVQMFKHLLGIYNYLADVDQYKHKKVRLVNCVWQLPESTVLSKSSTNVYITKKCREEEEFKQFYEAATPLIDLLVAKGIDFDILLLSVKDLMDCISYTDPQKQWLNRYLSIPQA